MKFIKVIFGLIFIALNEIIKFFIKRSIISLLLIFGLCINHVPFSLFNETIVTQQSQMEKNFARQRALIIYGGENKHALVLEKGKKFDLAFHHRLEQHFPDWENRMNYQKKQEKFYKSAMKKESELKRLRIKDTSKFYTKRELDAIDYFYGTGWYKKQQDPSMKPNVFDTRQSFLLKMHDQTRLIEFLDSFNCINN